MLANQPRSTALEFDQWRWTWRRAAVGAIAIAVVVGAWISSISDSAIRGDEWGTLDVAFNVANRGVFSKTQPETELDSEFVPTNYREPLPPVLLACWLKLLSAVRGPLSYDFLKEGPGVRLAKLPNILWGVVLCASVFAALLVLTETDVLAVLGAVIVGLVLDVDTLLTEPAAAALLALASFFCMMAIRSGHGIYSFLSGLSVGLLILTKAIFFYLCIALIGCLFVLLGWHWFRAVGIKATATGVLMFVLGIAIVIGPWMARNLYHFGSAQISQRAGIVLMMRARYDEMSWTEYKGTFYVWAPNKRIQQILGKYLGFNRRDLKKGGRLQRLVEVRSDFRDEDIAAEEKGLPEAAITYYYRARAERVKIERDLEKHGHPSPEIAADTELRKRALRVILNEPLKHAMMAIPFLWRAAFFIAPILVLCTILAIRWRRLDLVAYVLPALGMVVLYAVTSHNEPRYDAPAGPIAVACLIVLAWYLVLWLGEKRVKIQQLQPS